MKSLLLKTSLLLATVASSSFAIFGIGGHWAPNLGAGLDASKDSITNIAGQSVTLDQKAVDGLQGFGVKLWIDAIPFVDIEASSNLQVARYKATIDYGTTSLPLEVATGLPIIATASPVAGILTSDLTIKYPLVKFPPVVSIVKVYVGAGVSHMLTPKPLTADFALKALEGKSPTSVEEIQTAIIDAYKKEGLNSGIGGHFLVGAKAKVPVIPIAVYADIKYHFGGNLPEGMNTGMTLQLGGALAF